MQLAKLALRRCAIYTRKSSEEGLEQDFNSLHAQREACEAYIKSQSGEGWRLIKTVYDDGGVSGGTMERAALQQLLAHIREKLIDVVVVYKVDRLTRSLADFAKMVEIFDAGGVSFVAVTQQFNTTTSMGRLTLNVLLSFAQFEREVTGERIRDKIAASKRKGMWMGGVVSLGYEVQDRKLVIVEAEAEAVRMIFRRYLELGCVRLLRNDLDGRAIRSKTRVSKKGLESGGKSFSRGALYELLANPIYIGQIRHKGICHQGLHEPIIDQSLWERVQQLLRDHTVRKSKAETPKPGPLAGKLFDEAGEPLVYARTFKGERRYRYYFSRSLANGSSGEGERGWRLPATEIERSVLSATRQILNDRVAIASAVGEIGADVDQVRAVLHSATQWCQRLNVDAEAWTALKELVERVDLKRDGIGVTLRLAALTNPGQESSIATGATISRFVPLVMQRRGAELRLIIEGDTNPPMIMDPALLKAVARARIWFERLASGHVKSVSQLADSEGLHKRYLRRVLSLAFLAPEIVEAIVESRQPVNLTAQKLLNRIDLPMDWKEQKKVVGLG
ncbi:MAG: recombinase family protein [Candidatus Binatus sp.]|uniref:recombinase family protein n=1 Tax=Candidatus Binatus sp. TaxID=2811406 RepID=UPI0027282B52|nr:recombinase family protein [Candidatus Binatus sp.]MDO8430927.1 recombinase family protein [Candidatus Binatus sp.]